MRNEKILKGRLNSRWDDAKKRTANAIEKCCLVSEAKAYDKNKRTKTHATPSKRGGTTVPLMNEPRSPIKDPTADWPRHIELIFMRVGKHPTIYMTCPRAGNPWHRSNYEVLD